MPSGAQSRGTTAVFPSRRKWGELKRDLKLNAEQAQKLWFVLRHAVEDIADYRLLKSREQPRDILVVRLKRLEKALTNLEHEIQDSIDLMERFLPHETMAVIGRSFTYDAIRETVGEGVSLPHMDRDSLGIKYGHKILQLFVRRINAPLKAWVEMDKTNKGGRPPDMVRRYLIYRLAEAAPDIVGKDVPVASKGWFVDFCWQILVACGLSEVGIDKAIPAIVRQVHADQAN